MSTNFKPTFEIPEDVRSFAEKSVEQSRKAFDGFISAAQKTLESIDGSAQTARASVQDIRKKTLTYAEQNVRAAFDHAQNLVRAKDLQEAIKLQTEFVQSQFASIQEQLKELGTQVQKSAAEAGEAAKNAASAATKRSV